VEPILEALLVHVGGVIEGAFGNEVGGRALGVAWPVVRRLLHVDASHAPDSHRLDRLQGMT
jgi:hypothetical protein